MFVYAVTAKTRDNYGKTNEHGIKALKSSLEEAEKVVLDACGDTDYVKSRSMNPITYHWVTTNFEHTYTITMYEIETYENKD